MENNNLKRRALGRGLEELFNNEPIDYNKMEEKIITETPKEQIIKISLDDLRSNPYQPRVVFETGPLEELANSIKQHGIIQPLVLRRVNDKYEIIAGERRYKAATIAGLTKVPAVIADVDDNKSAEVAIVENVQRRDLTPIEEARSYKNLLDKGYLTQAELAKKMGISQSAIANKLRLLNLDSEVQDALLNNKISERHARSLLILPSSDEQQKWLRKIIEERMTVRELDEALKEIAAKKEIEVEEDIPLVKALDIDAIKKEATELPKIDEESDIARRLREIEDEHKFNPDVIPADQATNNSKNNFFNFLENETVNMNTEEPVIDIKPAFEMPKASTEDNNITNISNFSNENVFDPVSLIDTLDPTYEEKQVAKMGLDLKTAINNIRDAKDSLSTKGFQISMEESDLIDSYQFIIKIKKD